MDLVHLVDGDVRDLVVLRHVVTGIVAFKTLRRLDIAATQNVFRQKDVDEAFDVERHVRAQMRRIDGDDQTDRDALVPQLLRELQRAASAHGVADQDDRRGILLVGLDRRSRDQVADCEFVDVGRDAGALDLFRQPVHAAREDQTHRAPE